MRLHSLEMIQIFFFFFVIQIIFHCSMEFILNILNYYVWYYSFTRFFLN